MPKSFYCLVLLLTMIYVVLNAKITTVLKKENNFYKYLFLLKSKTLFNSFMIQIETLISKFNLILKLILEFFKIKGILSSINNLQFAISLMKKKLTFLSYHK